ncbi:MAG TPA: type VI secretion system protein TssA [Vicinamibacterales bacterium]|jgi:type VI secretion system protein ImpA|nr:type VI secretion system protein TssA [Vicinamibacterales bacterium]
MSARWDADTLLQPLPGEQPCGVNLDDTGGLVAFDALRLFGQPRSPEAPPDTEDSDKETAKAKPPIDWGGLQADALDGLAKSKDLRLLAYLGTAVLRTEGLPSFTKVLTTASAWLEAFWPQLYPLLDEDAIARRNALNCLADPMAVIDRVWRLPLVESRQHGRFGLRDIEMARGQVPPGALEGKPDEAAILAAFAEMPIDGLTMLDQSVANGMAALNAIDARMRSEGGPDVAPDFAPLSTQLAKMNRFLREQVEARNAAGTGAGVGAGHGAPAAGAAFAVGAIASRQDAIRALDAVAEYFRRNEPSSPIPLFVDRAKRLVAKDFLEVLADIAPDALSVARSAGGLKNE